MVPASRRCFRDDDDGDGGDGDVMVAPLHRHRRLAAAGWIHRLNGTIDIDNDQASDR